MGGGNGVDRQTGAREASGVDGGNSRPRAGVQESRRRRRHHRQCYQGFANFNRHLKFFGVQRASMQANPYLDE